MPQQAHCVAGVAAAEARYEELLEQANRAADVATAARLKEAQSRTQVAIATPTAAVPLKAASPVASPPPIKNPPHTQPQGVNPGPAKAKNPPVTLQTKNPPVAKQTQPPEQKAPPPVFQGTYPPPGPPAAPKAPPVIGAKSKAPPPPGPTEPCLPSERTVFGANPPAVMLKGRSSRSDPIVLSPKGYVCPSDKAIYFGAYDATAFVRKAKHSETEEPSEWRRPQEPVEIVYLSSRPGAGDWIILYYRVLGITTTVGTSIEVYRSTRRSLTQESARLCSTGRIR